MAVEIRQLEYAVAVNGPSPCADHRIVWRRDTAGPAVAALIDIVRELRDTGALLPHEPGERPDGTRSNRPTGTW